MNRIPVPQFPGVTPPSSDFQALRDGRRAPLFWYDVDLSTARSIAANTALILPIAANAFFSDQSPDQGYATVHFQDTNIDPEGAPVYVGPGFVGAIGFTQLLIENVAQAGKRFRFFYSVDVDFKPSLSGQLLIAGPVTVTGSVGVSGSVITTPNGIVYASSQISTTALTANTPQVIVSSGSNLNGITLWRASAVSRVATNQSLSLLAKSGANPTSTTDGDAICTPDNLAFTSSEILIGMSLREPVKIPAGYSLSWISSSNESQGQRSALYTVN